MEEPVSSPPHVVLVDARAVIEGAEPLRVLWKRDPAEAARGLINLLSWAMGEQHIAFRVVLDHSVNPGDIEDEPGHLEVRRTRAGQSVSALMISELEEMLGSAGAASETEMTVVTSDLEVASFAAQHQVPTALGDLFAASLLGGSIPEDDDDFPEPNGLSDRDSAEWKAFVADWKARKKP